MDSGSNMEACEPIVERQYEYTLKWRYVLGSLVLGATMSAWFAYDALHLKSGRSETKTVSWAFATFGSLLAIFSLYKGFQRLRGQRERIAFTKDGFICPNRPWRKGEAFIRYSDITGLSLEEPQAKQKVLYIRTTEIQTSSCTTTACKLVRKARSFRRHAAFAKKEGKRIRLEDGPDSGIIWP